MGENTHTCCCDHSEEALLKRIGELAAEYKGKEGSLIQVLHMAQGIYGYLPLEVQKVIADALDVPLAEVSGVVTFYSFFSSPEESTPYVSVWEPPVTCGAAKKSWNG